MSAGLELRGLACRRGGQAVFAGVSTSVPAGCLLRVLGGNGAGKTSLLRMICGLLAPTRGRILWRGEPIGRQRDRFHRELAHVGHAPGLADESSALENLLAAGALAAAPVDRPAALAALAAAGLQGREHVPARTLSQGQRRRAALARLPLLRASRLWVLDEPFDGLDSASHGWLASMVEAQLDRGGVVALTSHQAIAIAASRTVALSL